MLNCHCRDCQRASGGPFSAFVIIPAEAFRLAQGDLRYHGSPSERGGLTRRGFCPECGSPVAVKPDAAPQFVALRSASLDDPGAFTPQINVWTCDALPGEPLDHSLPSFDKYPG